MSSCPDLPGPPDGSAIAQSPGSRPACDGRRRRCLRPAPRRVPAPLRPVSPKADGTPSAPACHRPWRSARRTLPGALGADRRDALRAGPSADQRLTASRPVFVPTRPGASPPPCRPCEPPRRHPPSPSARLGPAPPTEPVHTRHPVTAARARPSRESIHRRRPPRPCQAPPRRAHPPSDSGPPRHPSPSTRDTPSPQPEPVPHASQSNAAARDRRASQCAVASSSTVRSRPARKPTAICGSIRTAMRAIGRPQPPLCW